MSTLPRILAGAGLLAFSAQATALELFPGADPDYDAELSLAAIVGVQDPDVSGVSSDAVMGAELTSVCPILGTDLGAVRHQLSVTYFDSDDLEMTNLELNTHLYFLEHGNFAVGAGPGLGFVRGDADGAGSDNVFGGQLGLSARYTDGPLYLGAEARQQWTRGADLNGSDENLDNWRVLGKVGFQF